MRDLLRREWGLSEGEGGAGQSPTRGGEGRVNQQSSAKEFWKPDDRKIERGAVWSQTLFIIKTQEGVEVRGRGGEEEEARSRESVERLAIQWSVKPVAEIG
jgi:hypothetical protein